jgi:hypothetical protein
MLAGVARISGFNTLFLKLRRCLNISVAVPMLRGQEIIQNFKPLKAQVCWLEALKGVWNKYEDK